MNNDNDDYRHAIYLSLVGMGMRVLFSVLVSTGKKVYRVAVEAYRKAHGNPKE